MGGLRDLSIRRKIVAITIITSAVALLVANGGLFVWDALEYRDELQDDLLTTADIISRNSTASLAFTDERTSADLLSSLAAKPHIRWAAIYDGEGRLFARYVRFSGMHPPPRPVIDTVRFSGQSLTVMRPIVLDARRIGTIVVESSLDSLYARMRLRALTIGFILLAASVIALVLSHRLQRLIADPVLRLAEVARAVSAHQNYSLRATSQSRDEIGLLVGAFNEMLSQIERRDAELLSAKETLEQRVSERTAQLQTELKERQRAEAELEDRNLELEQTNRELDDFAYIASHDLKEPLRGIHNYSKFLLEDYGGQLDEDGSAKLHTLIRLSRRLETLIDSLLRYSRLGRAELTLRSVDLNEVVAEVVDTLAITLRERQIDLRIPRTLPTVECDREHIGEVFANLMTNAMKYNDKEKKWIEVGTAEPADPDERVVYVRDNGIGIPERHIEAVFRIFKRLHGRDQFGGGTGAGLTIVRKIVDRHHGRVWIESQPDEGTTIFFSLPKGNVNGGVHGPADPRDRGQS